MFGFRRWSYQMYVWYFTTVSFFKWFLADIILWTQCYLHRGTCLNAMKRFYFIFLPVVLVFLYSIRSILFVPQLPSFELGLRGGGDSFLFIFLKTKKNKKKRPRSKSNPGFSRSVRALLAGIHSRARYPSLWNRRHGLHVRAKK